MPNQLHSHPRKFGKDSRACRVCNTTHGLIRKYQLMICRRCFREQANLIGFHKYRWRAGPHKQTQVLGGGSRMRIGLRRASEAARTPAWTSPPRRGRVSEWLHDAASWFSLHTELNYFLISFSHSVSMAATQGKLELFKGYKSSFCRFFSSLLFFQLFKEN